MGIHVALHHQTSYRYDRPIHLAPQVVRLRPSPHCRTPILSYSLTIKPKDHFINWQQDPFSNYMARLMFTSKTEKFIVEVDLVAEMVIINPFDFFLEPLAESFPFGYEKKLKESLAPYLEMEPAGKELKNYLSTIDTRGQLTNDFLVALNQQLNKDIKYLIRLEPNVQSCEQTLTAGSGSCRDSAWLLVNILRHLGLAARFVSGYLIQLTPDVKSLDGPSGPDADFTDLHAWTEVYLPGAGWVGMDPTSGLFAGEGHIPLACSPMPQAAAPITGALDKCEVEFDHTMSVSRIFEAPRSTQPYPEKTWNEIVTLGDAVESQLEEADIHLTMGGEPTFVSIDDMDGDEWNTEALGEKKQHLAETLIKRLRKEWAPKGLLLYGQGKWYPGEPLPRWALACYWRKDGKPVWTDDRWLGDVSRDYGYGPNEAKLFIETLVDNLGVDRKFIIEAYEDILRQLLDEQELPINVEPSDPKLKDPQERERMIRSFRLGLGEVSGYVLPLQHGSWLSGPWPVRGGHLFLKPGDSPMGLRLPLDSLPWVSESDTQNDLPLDPLIERKPLPDLGKWQPSALSGYQAKSKEILSPQPAPLDDPQPAVGESAGWLVRTALCVQPREGRLYIFMPPVTSLEGYLELTALIEKTAMQTGMPIVLEGYGPPYDPRLQGLKITPDPGVIEVNIQPMHNWRELVQYTTSLYEIARETRLGTEKFMVDGRHTGTGGGNHVVIGGATPAESPFLRRPDLLRSFITFWNNHPSLSYLFSGLFIGPTSQQPRIDEARHDALYELEIAFTELDRQTAPDTPCAPWLVDRLFRNLLVDVTGNTHRTEFCIDKLYSPDTAAGRLGLLEFRAFEMPPHAQMSLAQQLLLRICLVWFWKSPYRQNLVRWNTRLNDQFMLPEMVRKDFEDVLILLNSAGFPVSMDFFHPHFEFRFPVFGTIEYQGVELELRQALEPWHVLGEEPGASGTARYVDSSIERVQVKVTGMTGGRHMVTCNGRSVPLQPTGVEGVFVAGIRYRAWQPPHCLHPTIGSHTPLVIDLFDTWSERAVAGCTYYVGHPGGRHHEVFPVNSYEAEGRRNARFVVGGHTPGTNLSIPQGEIHPNFPYTLDLRKG